jgi:hypothetical protein
MLPGRLADLSRTYAKGNDPDLVKDFFPHTFMTANTLDYVGENTCAKAFRQIVNS